MSDTADKPDSSKNDAASIIATARKRLKAAMSATSESRTDELDDLRFAAGSPDNKWQWPQYAMATRINGDGQEARPTLTINKLPQHIRQVTNDIRQNQPSGKVIPACSDADADVAEVFEGMVRFIEYDSDSDIVYETAAENQVTFGEGYWRILTVYDGEDSFDLKIVLERIENSFSVYMDPTIKQPCGDDADWCLIGEDIPHDEYTEMWPDATPVSTLEDMGIGDESIAPWITDKTVRICEYFRFVKTREKLWLFNGNKTAFEGTPEFKVYSEKIGPPIKFRMAERRKVKWYKINGVEILEERDWAGKYIPVIRVPGNEFLVEGQRYVSGLVRNAKDAQRMYNYYRSQETEMIALAPKSPFIGYESQFEGFEDDWKTANTKNHPYLQVNASATDQEGRPLPLPQRVAPPMVQTGLIEAAKGASEDIKETTGQYNASLGQTSNERSGKAILARQHEGDVSTYHFVSNLSRAIRYSTRQLVDLIPKIYDTSRVAQIIGEDGTHKPVKIDPEQSQAVMEVRNPPNHPTAPNAVIEKIYNPAVGKYNVRVVTGPNFATKRQEAMDSMREMLQAYPELWHIAGDLFAKNMDWPGAQEIAKRLMKTIDPKILVDGDENPALQQAQQQIQQLAQQLDQCHKMLMNAHNSIEAREVAVKEMKVKIDAYDAETRRIAALKPAQEPGLTEEQIQEIATGTVHAAMQMPDPSGMMGAGNQGEAPPQLDPNKVLDAHTKLTMQANQHAHEASQAQFQAQQAAQQPAPEGQ